MTLSFSDKNKITGEAFRNIGYMDKLEIFYSNISDYVLRYLNNVKELHLIKCPNITDTGLENLLEGSVKTLYIYGCSNTILGVTHLIQRGIKVYHT